MSVATWYKRQHDGGDVRVERDSGLTLVKIEYFWNFKNMTMKMSLFQNQS